MRKRMEMFWRNGARLRGIQVSHALHGGISIGEENAICVDFDDALGSAQFKCLDSRNGHGPSSIAV